MKKYAEMTLSERQAEYAAVKAAYEQQKALGLKLNMARGKPGRDQLDMVTDIFNVLIKPEDFIDETETETATEETADSADETAATDAIEETAAAQTLESTDGETESADAEGENAGTAGETETAESSGD